jgi:hypothetical protein
MATTDEHICLPFKSSALARPSDRHMLMLMVVSRRLSGEGHSIPSRDQASAELIILVREWECGVEPSHQSKDTGHDGQVPCEYVRVVETVTVLLHSDKLIVPPTQLHYTKAIGPTL